MRRRSLLFTLAALGLCALSAPPALATDKLPDLRMMRLSDIKVQRTSGTSLLRYSTRIANGGVGPFEVRGSRSSTKVATMSVAQNVATTTGTRTVATPATMFYAGDGHNHWHVRDLESGTLTRLDNGAKVGTLVKRGFCFFDNLIYDLSLAGAPQSPRYTECGAANALTVTMGLSVGWADLYPADIAYQYIDITGLTSGKYRLTACASTQLGFVESSASNNCTWADLQLLGSGSNVKVLQYG